MQRWWPSRLFPLDLWDFLAVYRAVLTEREKYCFLLSLAWIWRTSTQFRGACFTNGSNSHTASWWLHFTFFCSDNAGSLSKVLTTEEEIHKEKENSAANIYSGINVKQRTFSWKQVKIHRWKNLLHITIEYRWKTVKDVAASSNYTNNIEQEHWRSNYILNMEYSSWTLLINDKNKANSNFTVL